VAGRARLGAGTPAAAPAEREERKAEARPALGRADTFDAASLTDGRPGAAASASGLAARLARKPDACVLPPFPG
jgi:hypothetical protein